MYAVVLAGLVLGGVLAQRQGGPQGLLAPILGTSALVLLPGMAAAALMVYCGMRSRRDAGGDAPEGFESLPALYSRSVHAINILQLVSYAVSLHFLNWAAAPARLHVDKWELPSRALVAAPFLLSVILAWIPLHYAETNVRRWGPTLAQQLSFNIRQYVLTLCVPMAIILGMVDAGKLLPRSLSSVFERPVAGALVGLSLFLGGYAVAPMVIVRVWKTSRLGQGVLRDRLTGLCLKIGVTFRDIRVWETPGLQFANAAVMGIAGRFRYIVVSRTLLEMLSPDQVEAVFAHELGHARLHHMTYYLVFGADFLLLGSLLSVVSGAAHTWPDTAYTAALAASVVLYWGVGFGYLSRAFEREADLFGAETVGDRALFATALEMIARFNGVRPSARSWRHGSIQSRVEFLRAAAGDVREDFVRKAAFLKVYLVSLGVVLVGTSMVMAMV